jgi:hypothetical protein
MSFANEFYFLTSSKDVTMAKLRLELLKEEAKELSEGTSPHKVSAGEFLRKAIEIKDRR